METLYAICRDLKSFGQITVNHKNDFSLIMELFPHLKHLNGQEVTHWFKCSNFPHYVFPERCRYDYAVARRDDIFWILDGNKKAEITSSDNSKYVENKLYWFYDLSGLHEGAPIKIAVKDPRPEFDEDGWAAVFDEMVFADDLSKPVCDVLSEWYHQELIDAVRFDISESWD